MKSQIKSILIAGYNHGLLTESFVGYWFRLLKLRGA